MKLEIYILYEYKYYSKVSTKVLIIEVESYINFVTALKKGEDDTLVVDATCKLVM